MGTADKKADLDRAMLAFAQGFAFTRCFTYPARAKRAGRIWVIRDEPRTRATDYRREEWAAYAVDPIDLHTAARKGTRGRYCICAAHAFDESDVSLRGGYRELGYRLHATEAFMMHRLKKIPKFPVPFPIQRVVTTELADKVAKSSGRRQILPEHLKTNQPLRLYTALDGQQPVGWLRSITTVDSTWVSNVYVMPKYRRKGIGKSLLAKMLRDDRKFGSKQSVLLASHAGALLYDSVGYEQLGTLLIFTPLR